MEIMQGSAERRAQLDQWMDERRRELRLRWSQVAERAGMGTPNLLRIRKNKIGISWDAADGIDDALEWPRGSVEAAVLEGVRPVAKSNQDEPPAPGQPAIRDGSSNSDNREWTEVDESRFSLLEQLFDSWGEEMTPDKVQAVLDELAKRLGADSPQGTGVRSIADSERSPNRTTRK